MLKVTFLANFSYDFLDLKVIDSQNLEVEYSVLLPFSVKHKFELIIVNNTLG